MKKIFTCLMIASLLLTAMPGRVSASEIPVATMSGAAEAAEAQLLIARLHEIKALDKKEMTFSQKKELRKEVRAINSTLHSNDGIYLSVGAIIIIVLLLIILL
jgi:hypothetical protein